MVFLLLLVLWLAVEIALFVIVGDKVGVLNTLLLCLGSVVLGIILMKRQGISAFSRLSRHNETQTDTLPLPEIFDGFCLLLGGILLIVPGFASDVLGLLLFWPWLRRQMFAALTDNPARRFSTEFQAFLVRRQDAGRTVIIEGHARDITDDTKDNSTGSAPQKGRQKD